MSFENVYSYDRDDYPYSSYDVTRGSPPLIKTKSRIIHCIVNGDDEGLKSLINYPNLFHIHDGNGYPILHIAILRDNIAAFDLLLSLDDCPLDTCNEDGETALEMTLTDFRTNYNKHFALSLLKKGAKIDYVTRLNGNSLLHYALDKACFEVALLLIQKGADLNCQNDYGNTPIHLCARRLTYREGTLAMLLYFGADPSIPNFEGFRLVDFVLADDECLSISKKETLLFYVFDEYTTDYEIPIDTLFCLFEEKSPLFPKVLKYITSVNVERTCKALNFFFMKLFKIKSEYLKLLLEKFDYVIDEILNASVIEDDFLLYYYAPLNEMFIQNFDLLLQSRFSSAVIQIINGAKIDKFIQKSLLSNVPQKELFESIMVLLSYGANICDKDLKAIYKIFGDCEYFRILLHMDIEKTHKHEDCDRMNPRSFNIFRGITRQCQYCDTIMPTLLYNIHFDIETFLAHRCSCPSTKALIELMNYFAYPKLKDFCLSVQNEEINTKVKSLPSVPLLVELARKEVRTFLIQKYKINNSMQFYTVIKHLPISKVHEKIITFETKLY